MMLSFLQKIQLPFRAPRVPTILSSIAVVILAIILASGSTRNYVYCQFRQQDHFYADHFWIHWSDFTFLTLSVTIASVLVASGAYFLSSWVPRSNPLSESSAILLFSLSNLSGLFAMFALLVDGSRAEAFRSGIEELSRTSAIPQDMIINCWLSTSETWYLTFAFLLPVFILSVFAVRSIREQLESAGTPATVMDILQHGLQALKNLYHYGHVGIISTTDFVRSKVFSGDTVVMARRRGDSLFREVGVSRTAQTIAALNARVIEALGMPQDATLTIIKNGEILVDRDADVTRLRFGDKLEVEVSGTNPNYSFEAGSESSDILAAIATETEPLTEEPPQRSRLAMQDDV